MDSFLIAVISTATTAAFVWLYRYLKSAYSFWKDRGVPYLELNLLFGNSTNMILQRIPTPIEHLNWHRKLSPHPYGGIYSMQKPELLVRYPELIKLILTKDFQNFQDRGMKFDYEIDPLARHLFGLNGGREWKSLRAKLTTTFTGGKMRLMFPLVEECAFKLVDDALNDSVGDTIDIKDRLMSYTIDVIGSCAFGLDLGAIKNPDSQFRRMALKISATRFRVMLRVLMPWIPKRVVKLFKMHFIEPEVSDFFLSLVKNTVDYREKHRVTRNDFLDLLINLRNEGRTKQVAEQQTHTPEITNDDSTTLDMTIELLTAQCLLFFAAGSDTSGNVMSFFFFEIARHTEIQNKLRDEIDGLLKKNNGKLSYELLHEMIYMDMVINETMRMYPPVTMISRQCAENYKLPDSNVIIPKGMQVSVSNIGVHYDEQNYRKPEVFNPNNFSPEEKLKRHPYAFIPFGEGPRRCIAGRFAMMQMKTAIVRLIENYEFSLSERTKLPLAYKHFGLLTTKDGIWLRYKRRKNSMADTREI